MRATASVSFIPPICSLTLERLAKPAELTRRGSPHPLVNYGDDGPSREALIAVLGMSQVIRRGILRGDKDRPQELLSDFLASRLLDRLGLLFGRGIVDESASHDVAAARGVSGGELPLKDLLGTFGQGVDPNQ